MPLFLKTQFYIISIIYLGDRIIMVKKEIIRQLMVAKKLLMKSEELIDSDSIENNLVVISNLNFTLNLFLETLGTQQKIKTLKELNIRSLEEQWTTLSNDYERRYGQKLSMKTQIFTISNITKSFTEHNVIPTKAQVHELVQALSIFMHELTSKVFGLDFQDIDFHLLMDNPQVRRKLKLAEDAINNGSYKEVLKNSSLAFNIALEDQRHKLNFLSEKGILKPELFMLDKSISLHFDSKDHEFIHTILGTQQKKLEQFNKIVPTVIITEDDDGEPKIVISDFVDEDVVSKDNARFCIDFVFETILHWESLDLVKDKDIDA